jgi:hypothetical protein
MEWDDEKCLNLIEIYRNNPLLWDPKDRNYYKKHQKDGAWAEIGVAMHTTCSDCKQKLVNLLASFRWEKMKTKKSMGNGRGKCFVFIYNSISFKELCMTMSLYSRIHSVSVVQKIQRCS